MIEIIPIEILNTGHITNCYLYYNTNKEAILIDAPDKAEIIIDKIRELEIKLKYILLTHAHADHTMALEKLAEYTGAQVVVNEKEKDTLDAKVQDYSIAFGTKQYPKKIKNIKYIEDGEIIKLDNVEIKAIETPGHTSGSTSYYIQKENILFTGDSIFSDCVGRWDLETASLEDTIETVIKVYKNFKEKNTLIYPGHGQNGIGIKETFIPISRIIFNNSGVDLSNML